MQRQRRCCTAGTNFESILSALYARSGASVGTSDNACATSSLFAESTSLCCIHCCLFNGSRCCVEFWTGVCLHSWLCTCGVPVQRKCCLKIEACLLSRAKKCPTIVRHNFSSNLIKVLPLQPARAPRVLPTYCSCIERGSDQHVHVHTAASMAPWHGSSRIRMIDYTI